MVTSFVPGYRDRFGRFQFWHSEDTSDRLEWHFWEVIFKVFERSNHHRNFIRCGIITVSWHQRYAKRKFWKMSFSGKNVIQTKRKKGVVSLLLKKYNFLYKMQIWSFQDFFYYFCLQNQEILQKLWKFHLKVTYLAILSPKNKIFWP